MLQNIYLHDKMHVNLFLLIYDINRRNDCQNVSKVIACIKCILFCDKDNRKFHIVFHLAVQDNVSRISLIFN